MKKYLYPSLIFSILFIFSCGDVENGVDGVNGLNTIVDVRDYSGSECSDGGIEISVGLDDNGDGSLSSLEVDNTQYVCDGSDGSDGQDGQDGEDGTGGTGGDNVTVLMVNLTGSEFGFVDSNNDGYGFLGVTVTNSVITSDVVNEGTITVEKLIDGLYYQLPFTNYYGESSQSYGYSVEGYYMYSSGSVDIVWGSTYLFSPSEWNSFSDLWSGTYKIRVVSPS